MAQKLSLIEEYTTIVPSDISHMQYPKELLHDTYTILKNKTIQRKEEDLHENSLNESRTYICRFLVKMIRRAGHKKGLSV